MSTKTYAGFREEFSASGGKWAGVRYGIFLVPSRRDEDDDSFSTRFGTNPNGSGPWMKVRRVFDGNTPSTDGNFNAYMNYSYRTLYIRVWEGTKKYEVSIDDSGDHTRLHVNYRSYDYSHYEYRPTSRYRYKVYYHYLWQDTEYLPYAEWPFTVQSLYGIYVRGDFAALEGVFRWCVSHVPTLPGRLDYPKEYDTYYEYQTAAFVSVQDFTPPEAVYLEYLRPASMYLETGILPGSWAMALETAYIEAGKSLPQSATNVAANVLEAAEMLASLFTGRFLGELPKNARQAWLAYRYAYTTTKLDIRDFQETFSRLDDLTQMKSVSTYGLYVRDGITFRVGYEVDPARVIPTDVSSTLRKFGLELNALNVWDMIPFSFVVDWFLPVQDVIEYFQDIGACRYEPEDLWWSITTVIDGYEIYVRLPGRKLSTMPYLQLSSAGHRTIALRIADAVALFAP